MNNRYSLSVLAACLLGLNGALAQLPVTPNGQAIPSAPPSIASSATNAYTPGEPMQPSPELNRVQEEDRFDYLHYGRPGLCCTPVGKHGPIYSEIFTRHGVSFPLGGNYLGRALQPGYTLQGGGRTLFFDPPMHKATVVELGIASVWWDVAKERAIPVNDVSIPGPSPFDTPIPLPFITPSSMNQTWVHASLGHEIYLLGGPSDSHNCEPLWRYGYDLGGRWGSAKAIYKEIQHGKDVVGGLFLALHSDYEVPYKSCLLSVGLRGEAAYIWSDIFQRQNNADVFTINLMVNAGVRF